MTAQPKRHHTPGPWYVESYGNGLQINLEDGFVIANLLGADDPFNDANASLIAAAPELLKQSIRVLKRLPHCGIYNETGMPELRAAIFKALAIQYDSFDAQGFEAAIEKTQDRGSSCL